MKPLSVAVLSLALTLAVSATAQNSPAKPSPEMARMAVFAGKWKLTETVSDSPFGKAGLGSYRCEIRLAHNGWALEARGKGQGSVAPLTWTEITVHDPETGGYRNHYFDSDGVAAVSPVTFDGRVQRGRWTMAQGGKTYQCQSVVTLAPDGRSYTYQWTYSEDGATWKPWLDGTARKVGSVR